MNRTFSSQPSASQPTPTRKYVKLPMSRLNFILMAIAGVMIVAGFLLMTGSASSATEFNPEIFSARRIVVGPTIAFLGFIFMGFGIMWPSDKKEDKAVEDDTEASANA